MFNINLTKSHSCVTIFTYTYIYISYTNAHLSQKLSCPHTHLYTYVYFIKLCAYSHSSSNQRKVDDAGVRGV